MKYATIFCTLLISVSVSASPLKILHDSGNTEPLIPILREAGFLDDGTWRLPEGQGAPYMPPPQAALMHVESPSLSPGVQARIPTGRGGAHLPRPIFLVGPDQTSIDWISSNRERLAEVGAVGLVVESSDQQTISKIKAAAGDLPLALGSGETLAAQFGITHYPVLIGPQWIEQ